MIAREPIPEGTILRLVKPVGNMESDLIALGRTRWQFRNWSRSGYAICREFGAPVDSTPFLIHPESLELEEKETEQHAQ